MPLKKIIRWLSGSGDVAGAGGAPFSVVFSTGDDFPNEHKLAKALLDAGLSRFHLRKPNWSQAELREWIGELPKTYRGRIVVHAFPELVKEMELGGFHMRAGAHRMRGMPHGIAVSQSCDSYQDLAAHAKHASYAMLGPVFPTFSRRDYTPHRTPDEFAAITAAWHADKGCPILALGGVTPENVGRLPALGFAGFAVISAVWETADPVKSFKTLLKAWK